MKLMELELSMDGLSKRSSIFDRIGQVLGQDWGALEEIMQKHQVVSKKQNYLDEEEKALQAQYIEFEKIKTHAA